MSASEEHITSAAEDAVTFASNAFGKIGITAVSVPVRTFEPPSSIYAIIARFVGSISGT